MNLLAHLLIYNLVISVVLYGSLAYNPHMLDLLIFCKLTPRFVIIEGTTREDYSNMKYHLMSGTKGLVMSIVFSGILALMLGV